MLFRRLKSIVEARNPTKLVNDYVVIVKEQFFHDGLEIGAQLIQISPREVKPRDTWAMDMKATIWPLLKLHLCNKSRVSHSRTRPQSPGMASVLVPQVSGPYVATFGQFGFRIESNQGKWAENRGVFGLIPGPEPPRHPLAYTDLLKPRIPLKPLERPMEAPHEVLPDRLADRVDILTRHRLDCDLGGTDALFSRFTHAIPVTPGGFTHSEVAQAVRHALL